MLDQWVASTPSPPNGGIDNRLDNAPRNSKDLESFAIPPQHPKTTHSAESAGDAMGYFPGVDPVQLENIRDNKMPTSEDWAVVMSWFNILQKTDPATLRRASIGPVTYAQLLRQPRSYCGRLVTVSGVVRRVHRLEVFRSPGDTEVRLGGTCGRPFVHRRIGGRHWYEMAPRSGALSGYPCPVEGGTGCCAVQRRLWDLDT